jgi:hypothetical protein
MINHPNRRRRAATTSLTDHDHEADYAHLLASVRDTFASTQGPLFATNAADLYERYLAALPAERDVHTCTACRRFIEQFGHLVTIRQDGRAVSAIWDSANAAPFYRAAILGMESEVERARIVSPFYSSEPRYGMPKTGAWTHFAVTPSKASIFKHGVLSARQCMASKREDFGTVARALADFTPDMLTEALRVLEADALSRSERFVAPVRWLLNLQAARAAVKDSRRRDNLLWAAIAVAPDGYCHPRSSVVGSLMEDIAAGLTFNEVKARWEAKMHPLQYQRPQAAPKAGAIAEAERLFDQMGLAPALERRFARIDEVEAIWRPSVQTVAQGAGVFGHLKAKPEPKASLNLPDVTMTWEKFARTVLPVALSIEVDVPNHGGFVGLTTAVHADAPPLLRWDREDYRNPVAWYLYHCGSSAATWGLAPGWNNVSALCHLPTMWGPHASPHLGDGVMVLIEGARDRTCSELCLFPETIRDELRGVRSVIEAHSKGSKLVQIDEPAACGLDMRKGSGMFAQRLRVTTAVGRSVYRIDRWD